MGTIGLHRARRGFVGHRGREPGRRVGITSRTIASLEYQWRQGHELLTNRDVLAVDEAGMIDTRQLERVLSAADAAGAKVVLVEDPEQLQAIEAGAAFRALAERHGAAEIIQIRRQRADCQSAYVGLSRRGDALQLHYGHDDFADNAKLARTLSRERAKDVIGDCARPEQDRDKGQDRHGSLPIDLRSAFRNLRAS